MGRARQLGQVIGIGSVVLCDKARIRRGKREMAMKIIVKLMAAGVVGLGLLGFGLDAAFAKGSHATATATGGGSGDHGKDHGDKHDSKDKAEVPDMGGDAADGPETEGTETEGASGR